MSTALATTTDAPIVTADQVALIKQTVAAGATDAELKLYLFDCARQGVHPLDRLIHFTKRGGKYTPITSIDFMRTRAADTNEYAGSDDAFFDTELLDNGAPDHVKPPRAAHVTVWRLVQGQRCGFSATARWAEYKPDAGTSGHGDVMWRKMPHTMLAKCAEALALRKGFPRQLAGLYAKEELDQASENHATYVVEAPKELTAPPVRVEAASHAPTHSVVPSKPNGGESDSRPSGAEMLEGAAFPSGSNLPAGAVYIDSVAKIPTRNKNVTKYQIATKDGIYSTIKEQFGRLAEQLCQDGVPVTIESHETKWGQELDALHRAKPTELDDPDPGFTDNDAERPF